jgi:hypothetical protein
MRKKKNTGKKLYESEALMVSSTQTQASKIEDSRVKYKNFFIT